MTTGLQAALTAAGLRGKPRVLAFVDLVQDIDVLLPLLVRLKRENFCALDVWVSRWLAAESPRTEALLAAHGVAYRYVRRGDVVAGRSPSLRGVAAVVAASESSHPAHAAGHALALRARSVGARTYLLQHGLENVGLLGLEAGDASFASETVFCWFPPGVTPGDLAAGTAASLAHVGRCDPIGGWRRGGPRTFDLGVFENLHWERYDDSDRERFLNSLTATARALPQARILLRPHPAGGWADRVSHELAPFPNITPARAIDARRDPAGSPDLLQGIQRVITTPSTIALDAALAGLPIAMAVPGGSVYEPLPVLRTLEDWVAFAGGGMDDPAALDQFRSRVLVDGDAGPRIVERLRGDLAGHLGRNG